MERTETYRNIDPQTRKDEFEKKQNFWKGQQEPKMPLVLRGEPGMEPVIDPVIDVVDAEGTAEVEVPEDEQPPPPDEIPEIITDPV
jgi:hypothetical protein